MRHVWTWTLALAASLALGACQTSEEKQPLETYGTAGQMGDAKTLEEGDEILDNPTEYIGEKVRLRGEVTEVVAPNSFKVDLDGWIGGDEILVVNGTGGEVHLGAGDMVDVIGPVRLFTTSQVEREIENDLVDKMYIDFENQPIIVAKEISILP